jgi:hypothetical protein
LSKLKIHVDLGVVFQEFFKLKDWKQRSLYLGGIYTLISLIFGGFYFVGSFLLVIPFFGILLFLIPIVLIGAFMMAYSAYLIGYRLDIAEAYRSSSSIEDVAYMGNYSTRIKRGIRLAFAQIIYTLPAFTLLLVGYIGVLFAIFAIEENPNLGNESLVYIGMLLSIVILFLGVLLQMAIYIFLMPILNATFLKNNDLGKLFDFKYIWKLVKANWADAVLIWAILSLLNVIIITATYFAWFLVLLCVGLLVLPVIMAITTVYRQHVHAHLIAELANKMD